MPDFSEMMRRRPTTQEFYFEWEGLQIFGAIDITDVPKELEIRFTSPHPAGEVALRLNAFGCSLPIQTESYRRESGWFMVM